MNEIFYRYNPWWEEKIELKGIINRPIYLEKMESWFENRQIVFLVGLRRIGKTTLLKLFIHHLIHNKNIAPKNIFYISLDDYLISKYSILEIVEEYRKIQKIPFEEKIYLFLDEVAYKQNFEQELKNLYDIQNVKIYASSSSASTLKDKKAYLTGRAFVLEVLSLDFEEFLSFRKINLKERNKHLRESYFEEYLQTGGIPEYVLTKELEYLKELVDDIIYKDIVAFHGIRNPQIIKDFFVLLMERSGKQVSINKLARILSISPDTAKRYLQMFVETYLIYLVPRYGKTNVKLLSTKKLYTSDLGIKNLFTGYRDKGSIFENYVFLKIKHKNPCYIYEDGTEIDFLTADKTLIEVKFNSDLNKNQLKLFKSIKAKNKIIIKNIDDLNNIALI